MIRDLRYAVTFPTNSVTLSGGHSFQPGITAVTGRNGTGKSFIAEMIRYGLFGKKALRGPASDYKDLDMAMSFDVGDRSFNVARNRKAELLTEGDTQLAVGADAVNKTLLEILGFPLEVFDVVCAANQKESERLTKLTPARRKELIDDVVGLAQNETVERACRDEANGLRREAEALSRNLVVPVEPVKPKGYRASAKIEADLRETKVLVEKRTALQRTIDSVGDAPIAPEAAEVDVAELELHEQKRIAAAAHRVAVERQLASMPAEPKFTLAQIKAAEALAVYDAELGRRGSKPTVPLASLDAMAATWGKIAALEDLKGEVECPSCEHRFVPAQTAPAEPQLSLAEIMRERRAHDNWATPLNEPAGERIPPEERSLALRAHHDAPMRAALTKELTELAPLADRSAELKAARAATTAWAIHRAAVARHESEVHAAAAAAAELKKLAKPKHSVEELDAAFVAACIYETQLTNYAAQRERFEALTKEIADKQEKAEAFSAGAKGLVEARRTLKAFLAPSLSRVATTLIQQMSVGAYRPVSSIVVDGEMNITADGQDVSTFNGAHATMINLALRLALGQVLVSRVFPVFIGDEIDSDCDVGNAPTIAEALGNLKGQVQEIILISHKRLENVDQEISLDETQ